MTSPSLIPDHSCGENRIGKRTALVEQAGFPVVEEWMVGKGSVDFIALDPAVAPFDAWNGTGAILAESASS